jgi:ATP-binding cassette, subfamily B, bacterial
VSTFANSSEKYRNHSLPAWKVILKMIQYRPGLWLGNLFAMLVAMMFFQVPGLAMRAFFDLLVGEVQTGLNLWTIIALLFAAEIGGVLGIYGLITTNVPFFINTITLLRKNLLTHILRRPGASALPDSPGEAISRFRGDVFEIPLFALWLNDIMGLFAFSVIALIIMLRISPLITTLALLPFIVVGIIASTSTQRIDEYRRASRRSTGIVTGFIGEFFGAVQAVKVANAEGGVIERFNELNEERRILTLKDRLFSQFPPAEPVAYS